MKIYLYKGGLHKITGVPRRWNVPKPTISLGVFKRALQKRSEAVRLLSASEGCEGKSQGVLDEGNNRKRKRVAASPKDREEEEPAKQAKVEPEDTKLTAEAQQETTAHDNKVVNVSPEPQNPSKPIDDEKARRRVELEEKLNTLTAEKHRNVLILKQILSSEEESKKRGQGSLQSPASVASPSLGLKPAAETSPVFPQAPTPPEMELPVHAHRAGLAPKVQGSVSEAPAPNRPTDLEEGELECARTPSPRPSGFSRQPQQSTQSMSRLGYHPGSSSGSAGYRSGRIGKWDSHS